MAAVDPYSLCPCGSGQKFKWCCHKVEAIADRAHRLFESGQLELALDALAEGLKKEPGNAWLLMRKAIYLLRSGQAEPAKQAVRLVLQKNPKHTGAHILLTRLVFQTEGIAPGLLQLQLALTALPAESRSELANLILILSALLTDTGKYPAAWAHLNLVRTLSGSDDPTVAKAFHAFFSNRQIPPWQKNQDQLSPPPAHLAGAVRERFEQALGWVKEGLFATAAATFEALSGDPVAGPSADRNLGFCRLWLADEVGAVAALRRYAARLGPTTEAVDIETLCQSVAPPGSSGMVEQVHLTWPVRNRDALRAALTADPTVNPDESAPLDPEDEESPEVDQFELLDRPALPAVEPGQTPKLAEIPRIVGRVLLGPDFVVLETFDDGRLDRLSERFVALAGTAIPPAHPKTKTVAKAARLDLALTWEWLLPPGINDATARRLTRDQKRHLLSEVWPRTPNPALGGKTPLEAAAAGGVEVPLRAALLPFEQSADAVDDPEMLLALRQQLQVPPEPPIDPATVDIAQLHLARLAYVPAAGLSDEALAALLSTRQRGRAGNAVGPRRARVAGSSGRGRTTGDRVDRASIKLLPPSRRLTIDSTRPPTGCGAADRPILPRSAPATPPPGISRNSASTRGISRRKPGWRNWPSSSIAIRTTRTRVRRFS